ncbi:MAG: Rpn family recombination-promoting nuclease/putative transposase, partial [Lachnospiraceae bacterium]
MGEKDISMTSCLKDKTRFADLCNAKLYGGRQMIRSEELELLDSKEALMIPMKEGKVKGIQRTHDIVMRWRKKILLMIITLEHQSSVHYAMPVRKMVYDGLAYVQQIREIFENREERELAREDFLSHFVKEDKLIPVIPIVFSCDLRGWNGSTDIHGMIDWSLYEEAESLQKLVPNYYFNLIDINDNSYIEKLKTDLQTIFAIVQYRQDKKKMKEYIGEQGVGLSRDIYYAITSIFGIGGKLNRKPMDIWNRRDSDMSNALLELIEEGMDKGRKEGHKEEHLCWSRLIQAMIENKEQDSIMRLTTDPRFFQEKLEQYHIRNGEKEGSHFPSENKEGNPLLAKGSHFPSENKEGNPLLAKG